MDDEREQFATGSIYLSLDSVANAFLGGIFWIVIAKLAVPEVVGQATFVVALTTILITFAGLGFHLAASKYISEHNSRGEFSNSRHVYSKTIQVTIASSVVIAAMLAVFSSSLASHNPQLVLLILIGAFSIPFQALVRSLNGVYQGSNRMAFTLFGDLTFLVLRLAIAVILVLLGYEALGIVLGYAAGFAASAMLGLAVLVPSALPSTAQKSTSPALFRQMFRFSMPNYFAGLALTGATQASIIILGLFKGDAPVAFYNIALLTKMVVVSIATSVGLALLPAVSASISRGRVEPVSDMYNLSLKTSILLSSVPAVILFLIPGRILTLVSPTYAQEASLGLQLLMLSTVGSVVFAIVIPVLNGLNRPITALISTSASSLLALAVGLVTIPLWGVEGAAFSNLVAGFSGAAIAAGMLAYRGPVELQHGAILRPVVSLASALGVGELLISRGVHPYVSVAVSLLILLLVSLMVRALRISEIGYIVRLTMNKMRLGSLVGGASAEKDSEDLASRKSCGPDN